MQASINGTMEFIESAEDIKNCVVDVVFEWQGDLY